MGAVKEIIYRAFLLYEILIIARVVISYIPIPVNKYTQSILRFIYEVTEPFLRLFRSILPPIMVGSVGVDLSPLIAILVLQVLEGLIFRIFQLIGI